MSEETASLHETISPSEDFSEPTGHEAPAKIAGRKKRHWVGRAINWVMDMWLFHSDYGMVFFACFFMVWGFVGFAAATSRHGGLQETRQAHTHAAQNLGFFVGLISMDTTPLGMVVPEPIFPNAMEHILDRGIAMIDRSPPAVQIALHPFYLLMESISGAIQGASISEDFRHGPARKSYEDFPQRLKLIMIRIAAQEQMGNWKLAQRFLDEFIARHHYMDNCNVSGCVSHPTGLAPDLRVGPVHMISHPSYSEPASPGFVEAPSKG